MTMLESKLMVEKMIQEAMDKLNIPDYDLEISDLKGSIFYKFKEGEDAQATMYISINTDSTYADGHIIGISGSYGNISKDDFAIVLQEVGKELSVSFMIETGHNKYFTDSGMEKYYEHTKYLNELGCDSKIISTLKRHHDMYSVHIIDNYKNKTSWLSVSGFEFGRFKNEQEFKAVEDKIYNKNKEINKYFKQLVRESRKAVKKPFYVLYDGNFASLSTSTNHRDNFGKLFIKHVSNDKFVVAIQSYEDGTNLSFEGYSYEYPFFHIEFDGQPNISEIYEIFVETLKKSRIDKEWADSYAFDLM